MRPKTPFLPRKQITSQELRDRMLDFIQRKFYEGHAVEFRKDQRRLLAWVILWPAQWLNERGVSLPDDQFIEIFEGILMDALRLGNTGKINYLPAWLAKVIQSHFAVHGDEIYERAKSIRTLAESALLVAGKAAVARPDPVRELAVAARLLNAPKRRPKTTIKTAINMELKLS